MKRFVAIVLVMMMMCGTAFASVQSEVDDILGSSYIYMGDDSVITELIGEKVPSRTMFAPCLDNMWYLEYRDIFNRGYCWYEEDVDRESSTLALTALISATYDAGYVNNCYIWTNNEIYYLGRTELGTENSFTDYNEFCNAVLKEYASNEN